jgi:hypothetical protein
MQLLVQQSAALKYGATVERLLVIDTLFSKSGTAVALFEHQASGGGGRP